MVFNSRKIITVTGAKMGWRGTLRSIEADRKRRERIEYRRNRLVNKADSIVDKAISSFDHEANRELEKIRNYETLLHEKPISRCKLHFVPPNRYEFAEFSDNKGIISFNFLVKCTNDDVQISPTIIEFEKRVFKIIGVCFSQYGTFIAFNLEYNKDVPGAKTTKLVNKINPDESLLVIRSGDQLFFPVEGDIDGQIIAGTNKTGIVVFEPFENPVDEFEIICIPKEENDNDDLKIVRVFGENVKSGIINANAAMSLFDEFFEELSKTKGKFVSNIENNRREVRESAKSTGCMTIMLATFGIMMLVITSIIM